MVKGHMHSEGGVCQRGGVCGKRGACVVKGGMHGKGACVVKGACIAKGHVWQRGHVWPRGRHAWYVCPSSTRYGRLMRGRYASYWNVFLLIDRNSFIKTIFRKRTNEMIFRRLTQEEGTGSRCNKLQILHYCIVT